MVPPLGIEPSSRVLQTRAEMTTLAQAAYMVLIAGFEPAASFLPRKRSSPDLYQHVLEGGIGFEPMRNGIKIRGLTRLGEPPVDVVPVPGFEPGTFRLSVECSTN